MMDLCVCMCGGGGREGASSSRGRVHQKHKKGRKGERGNRKIHRGTHTPLSFSFLLVYHSVNKNSPQNGAFFKEEVVNQVQGSFSICLHVICNSKGKGQEMEGLLHVTLSLHLWVAK